LPARGGVSPEVPNDLYRAHLALYLFAARHAAGRRVLDWGCGTGYGSARLAQAGALSVTGIDADARSIGYAERRFAGAATVFAVGDLGSLPGPFDLIVVPDLLSRVVDPRAAVAGAARRLAANGVLIAAVPPIVDEHTMEARRASGGRRTHLYVWDWETLLRRSFGELQLFGLQPPAEAVLDFADPFPSRLAAEDFRVESVAFSDPGAVGTVSAVFVCRSPHPGGPGG
jgi:SAM-dependent methyltransferase